MAKAQSDEDELAQHISRIVTAPYAVSLKDLHDLIQKVQKKNDHPCIIALRRWADEKPCQVDALAGAILDGLQLWPYTLEILGSFASSSESFRNAVLRLQPTLLDAYLKKAVDGDEKYFDTCISLLSYPLPEGILTPASLPSFVRRTIERMVQNPCAETAKSLYWLFSGIHGTILDILPEETLVGFLNECKKILRNLEDHMGNLFCLATLAKIVYPYTNGAAAASSDDQTKVETSADNTSERQESKQDSPVDAEAGKGDEHAPWLRGILQFFGPRHGTKTFDLVVARVILACSASSTLSLAESIHGIQLAKEICDALEIEQRDAWIRKNGTKLMKLCEKVLRPDIDPKVQVMGMVFLVSLLEVKTIPKEIVALAQQTLSSSTGRRNLDELPEDYMQLIIKKISPRFDQETLESVLKSLVSALVGHNTEGISNLSNVNISISIAAGLFSAMEISPPVKASIASVLATAPGQDLYKQVMTFHHQNKGDSCEVSCTCPSALSNAQDKLYIDISALFLGAHLALPPDQQSPVVEPSWTHAFLSALVQNAKDRQTSSSRCPSSPPRSSQCFDFFTSFPRTQPRPYPTHSLHHQPPGSSHDWKASLTEDLLKDAQQSHQTVIQRVSTVCRDLEDRCNNVEAPLRDMTLQLDKVTTDCKSAQEKNIDLEKKSKEYSQTVATLRDDNSKLEHQVQSSKTRAKDLSTRLLSAQKDLEDLKHRSEKDLAAVKKKRRDMELEDLAIRSARDETISNLYDELNKLREQLDVVSKKKSEVQESLKTLERELSESKQSVNEKSVSNTELQEEIVRLRTDKEYMRSVTDRLQDKLDENLQETKALNDQIREKEEVHHNQLRNLEGEQDEEHSKLTAKIKQQKKLHKEEVRKLQASLQGSESKAAQKIRDQDKWIESLENKVTLLRKERESKAREFAEAQELITKLTTVMDKRSFEQNDTQPLDTTKHSSGPAQERGDIPATEEGDTEQEQFETQVSYQGSSNSFASSNSTNAGLAPKRPENSRGPKEPRESRTSNDRKSSKASSSTTKTSESRKPLEDTDPNWSPSKTASKSSTTQSSSAAPSNSQGSKLASQFDIYESNDDSYNYSDGDFEHIEDDRFTSTPSV